MVWTIVSAMGPLSAGTMCPASMTHHMLMGGVDLVKELHAHAGSKGHVVM